MDADQPERPEDDTTAAAPLAFHFAQERRWLESRLPEDAETTEAASVLRLLLQGLPESCAARPDEALRDRLALAEELLRSAIIGTLSAVRAPEPAPPDDRPRPHPSDRRRSSLRWPFGREDEHGPELQRSQPSGGWRPAPRPTVNVPSLLQQVEGAFEAADRLLAAAQPPPPERVKVPWAEDGEIVDVLHELLSAHAENDGELALRQIARLKENLSLRHDIDAVAFDGTNDGLFSFGRNADPVDPRYSTVRPALVSSGRLLRRGEVRGPVPAAAPATGSEITPTEEEEEVGRQDG